MHTVILTEDSQTVADEEGVEALDYFKGNFRQVASLAEQLSKMGTVVTQIVSEEYGFLQGADNIPRTDSRNISEEEIVSEFTKEVNEADVVVILLTTSVFKSLVIDHWQEIANVAKPASTWCVSAGRKTLGEVDFSLLKKKECDVLKYQRVGVARIDTETQEKLLKRIQ